MTKSDFVRSQGNKPAKEIVALAKKKGIKLSGRYVYVIRSSDKVRAGRKAGARRDVRILRGNGTSESALRTAIAELGLARARVVMAEVEKVFG
jgi:hypothetical protein